MEGVLINSASIEIISQMKRLKGLFRNGFPRRVNIFGNMSTLENMFFAGFSYVDYSLRLPVKKRWVWAITDESMNFKIRIYEELKALLKVRNEW